MFENDTDGIENVMFLVKNKVKGYVCQTVGQFFDRSSSFFSRQSIFVKNLRKNMFHLLLTEMRSDDDHIAKNGLNWITIIFCCELLNYERFRNFASNGLQIEVFANNHRFEHQRIKYLTKIKFFEL